MKFKNIALIFLFSVIFLGLTGCGGSSGNHPSIQGANSTVMGRILNNQLVPIPNAEVCLYKSEEAYKSTLAEQTKLAGTQAALRLNKIGDNLRTQTNFEGIYTFNNVPDGEYTLLAMAGNNLQYTQTGIIVSSLRESLIQVDAQLTPTGNASGTITLNGVGVGGVVLYLDKTSYVTVSSDNGEFVFENIPAGKTYTLKILEAPITGRSNEVLAFSGTAPTFTAEAATTVTSGLTSIPLTTKLNSKFKYAMSGSVFDFNESPLSNRVVIAVNTGSPMAVSLRGGGNPAPETTQELAYGYTKSDGSYMIYVQNPGQYQLSIIPTNNKEIISPSVQMVSVDESDLIATPASYYSFTIISGFKVTGTVYDIENPKGGINILFYSAATEESYSTMSAPDGKYILYVPAGTYQVSVAGDYNVTYPSTDLTINSDTSNSRIEITAGETEYDNTATALSIVSSEKLEGFEAIDDYFYTVTTFDGIVNITRYAYNASDTVNYNSIYPDASAQPTKVSTAVLNSDLYVLTSYYDETYDETQQPPTMETYLYRFDKALKLNAKIPLNPLNEQRGGVIDTSLIKDEVNKNLYYAVVTLYGQMLWYKIGNTNTSYPFREFTDYTMFTVPEMCSDEQYVYYVLTSPGDVSISFELCRFNLYTGTVESMGSGSITDTNYFPIFQLSCDAR
ncbi:MAG: carboxypeptidase regulatory-like domain-containing protein, partial [Candidatus Riflebacteria bacterium]|nr:carboxypeptidase regulatory-like domain-containing protein [Candidatus Riflebacteria bacterium]